MAFKLEEEEWFGEQIFGSTGKKNAISMFWFQLLTPTPFDLFKKIDS